jgi:hypothetical protein
VSAVGGLQAIGERMERIDMLLELLHEVVARTGNTTEGYFAFKQAYDHIKMVGRIPDFGQALTHLDNTAATLLSAIERIGR